MKKKQAFQRKMEAAALKLQAQFRGRSGRRQAWARKHITGRAAHKSYLSSHSISVPDATMSLDGLLLLKRFIPLLQQMLRKYKGLKIHFVAKCLFRKQIGNDPEISGIPDGEEVLQSQEGSWLNTPVEILNMQKQHLNHQ